MTTPPITREQVEAMRRATQAMLHYAEPDRSLLLESWLAQDDALREAAARLARLRELGDAMAKWAHPEHPKCAADCPGCAWRKETRE